MPFRPSPVKAQEMYVAGPLLTKSLCTIKASHKVGNTFVWFFVIYFYFLSEGKVLDVL